MNAKRANVTVGYHRVGLQAENGRVQKGPFAGIERGSMKLARNVIF
jgi:hypothetical protein